MYMHVARASYGRLQKPAEPAEAKVEAVDTPADSLGAERSWPKGQWNQKFCGLQTRNIESAQ